MSARVLGAAQFGPPSSFATDPQPERGRCGEASAHQQHHHDYASKSFTASISTGEGRTGNVGDPSHVGEDLQPLTVHMNSMVIHGREPIVVDTRCPIHRDQYLDDLFAIVEAHDVRWVCISHNDVDHDGNLHQVIDACPNATVVASWFLCERLQLERVEVSPLRGVGLVTASPLTPVTTPCWPCGHRCTTRQPTRGLLDTTKGVYWATDCYSTPVNTGTAFVDQLPAGGGIQQVPALAQPLGHPR